MSLKVIGAGFGRTGTLSLKSALEKLGFGPCYHMMEVMARPDHVAMWHGLAFGKPIDWDVLFAEFAATVDWPACTFWRELADHYPDAKVLLSVRDPEAWWRSMNDTIYQAMTITLSDRMPPVMKQQLEMARKLVATDTFSDRFEDKAHAIAVFQRHTENVRANIDPKRLLVYEVKEGWAPLCRFLGVPQPAEPFPRLNDTATTQAMIKQLAQAR
jgi:hypothetical protein